MAEVVPKVVPEVVQGVADPKLEFPTGEGPVELAPDVVAERVGAGYVLVHLKTNRIYELQGTAARVYELVRAGRSREQIERELEAEFEVDADQLRRDLDRHLAELRRVLLVR